MWLFFLGTLLAVPLAVVANLLTPKVRQWMDYRTFTTKQKRLTTIEKELQVNMGVGDYLARGMRKFIFSMVYLIWGTTLLIIAGMEVFATSLFKSLGQSVPAILDSSSTMISLVTFTGAMAMMISSLRILSAVEDIAMSAPIKYNSYRDKLTKERDSLRSMLIIRSTVVDNSGQK